MTGKGSHMIWRKMGAMTSKEKMRMQEARMKKMRSC
jgi:hypothetical protein